jgi:6,7-dimethyl-8-ribityllumazine synthase
VQFTTGGEEGSPPRPAPCARDTFHQEWGRLRPGCAAPQAFELPGAFDIPLLAQRPARSGRFDGVVCCGLVVDGGIYRHDFVATAVIDGLLRAQLDTGVPVLSVVLTPHHVHPHEEHRRYFGAHVEVNGREAAQARVQTLRAQLLATMARFEPRATRFAPAHTGLTTASPALPHRQ